MDTSKEYIKMCEKAVEIQPSFIPFVMLGSNDSVLYNGDDVYAQISVESTDFRSIWLPRQGQLQEMLGVKTVSDLDDCGLLHGWDDGSGWVEVEGYVELKSAMRLGFSKFSIEQLWLAFVMQKNYNKVWVDGGWVEQL